MKWEQELNIAVDAAKAAGALLAKAIGEEQTVLSQEGRDIKLQADRDAEAIILERLEPTPYDILAEESGEHGGPGEDAPFWCVDPLDGTMNFNHGFPICCVSIALTQGNDPVLGVIYDFNRDELFTGIVSGEARFNGQPMRVSDAAHASESILCTGFPILQDLEDPALRAFAGRVRNFKKIRMIGSAALAAAYVACGRVDAYLENHVMLWDVAAGAALVIAAGGHVTLADSTKKKWARSIQGAANASIWDA